MVESVSSELRRRPARDSLNEIAEMIHQRVQPGLIAVMDCWRSNPPPRMAIAAPTLTSFDGLNCLLKEPVERRETS